MYLVSSSSSKHQWKHLWVPTHNSRDSPILSSSGNSLTPGSTGGDENCGLEPTGVSIDALNLMLTPNKDESSGTFQRKLLMGALHLTEAAIGRGAMKRSRSLPNIRPLDWNAFHKPLGRTVNNAIEADFSHDHTVPAPAILWQRRRSVLRLGENVSQDILNQPALPGQTPTKRSLGISPTMPAGRSAKVLIDEKGSPSLREVSVRGISHMDTDGGIVPLERMIIGRYQARGQKECCPLEM